MTKPHRCMLHLACMMAKIRQGRDFRWHWEHILREFGLGHLPAETRHTTEHHALSD